MKKIREELKRNVVARGVCMPLWAHDKIVEICAGSEASFSQWVSIAIKMRLRDEYEIPRAKRELRFHAPTLQVNHGENGQG